MIKTILQIIAGIILGIWIGSTYNLCSQNIHINRCEQERVNCENRLLMKKMGIEIAGASDEGVRRTWKENE